MKTPLALFAYNRPDHFRQTLEALTRCARLEECDVYIFCDAPKREEHRPKVEATRRVAREYEKILRATLIEREANVGLARSIAGETTNLCERYGRAIIVEDDLIVSPNFINFMLSGLDRYENDERVYQISGYRFPLLRQPKCDAFFLPLISSWGWATWQRSWNFFEWQPMGMKELLENDLLCREFNLDDSFPFSKMLRARLNGQNDSWAILWWYIVFQKRGLVLYPSRSLVWNAGADGSGTHKQHGLWQESRQGIVNNLQMQFKLPDVSQVDESILLDVKQRSRKRQNSGSSLLTRLWRRMCSFFKCQV